MLQQAKRCVIVALLSLLMVGAMGLGVDTGLQAQGGEDEGSCKACRTTCFYIFGWEIWCRERCVEVTPCG